MVGTRQFDEERVLDDLTSIFWEKGYEATSIDDLVSATGLKRGSLYNAFGDKEKMFHLALDRYIEIYGDPVRDALNEGDDITESIRACLMAHLELLEHNELPRGCLISNACVELAETKNSIGRRVAEAWVSYESDFYQALLRGQAAGQIAAGQDLLALARFLHGIACAMIVTHKVSGDTAAARDIAKVALRVFETTLEINPPSQIGAH